MFIKDRENMRKKNIIVTFLLVLGLISITLGVSVAFFNKFRHTTWIVDESIYTHGGFQLNNTLVAQSDIINASSMSFLECTLMMIIMW